MKKFSISPYSSLTLILCESAQTVEITAEDDTPNNLGLGYARTSTFLTSLANAHYSDGARIQVRLYNIFSMLAKGEVIAPSDTTVGLIRNTTVQFDTAQRGHSIRLASNSQGDINLNIKGQGRESNINTPCRTSE